MQKTRAKNVLAHFLAFSGFLKFFYKNHPKMISMHFPAKKNFIFFVEFFCCSGYISCSDGKNNPCLKIL